MIIRILGEGQFVLQAEDLADLNELDQEVEAAAQARDQERLTAALQALVERVRQAAGVVPDDILAESDMILPDANSTVEQILALLDETSEYPGLIPG